MSVSVRVWSVLGVCVAFLVPACGAGAGGTVAPSPDSRATASPSPAWNPGPGWKLSWNETFSSPNALSAWVPFVGGFSEESDELQYYSPKNVILEPGGGLAITATTNGYGKQCWYGTCRYSSALLETQDRFEQQYGVFSAYIKIPAERGLWPAFWMAGADSDSQPWPDGGEIDVIEVSNQKPGLVEGFAHSPQLNRGFYLQLPTSLSASYHEYSVEWTPTEITWLIDGHAYGHVQITPRESPFDQPFYLILDLAVGGNWPGPPTASTVFPAQLKVAWVRIYKYQTGP
jgi:beta-glucanase (GH16 family)